MKSNCSIAESFDYLEKKSFKKQRCFEKMYVQINNTRLIICQQVKTGPLDTFYLNILLILLHSIEEQL